MSVDFTSYLASGDLLGWFVAVFNNGTYNLGFPIVCFALVYVVYMNSRNAGIAAGFANIIIFGLISFGLIQSEIAGPVQIFAALGTAAIIYLTWKGRG